MKITKNKSPRFMAVEILNRVEESGAFAEPLLDAFLSRSNLTNISDRKLLTQIVYGTLRMRDHVDWLIRQLYRGDFSLMETGMKNILRTAMYQMRFTDRIPDFAIVDEAVDISKKLHPAGSGLVNAILRNAIRRRDRIIYPDIEKDPALYIATVHSHPLWLVNRWIEMFGLEETTAICRTNNEVPYFTLRVNRLKTTRERVLEELSHDGYDVKTTVFSPDGLIISNPAAPIRETALCKSGHIQVQDEASQLIAPLVDPKPGDTILDICTGTGGKAIHLAEIMGNRGHVLSLDINATKIKFLNENIKRQGITIVDTRVGDATEDLGKAFHKAFDRILIDAPCSGLGTLRRNPEIKWRFSEEALKKCVFLQQAILDKAALYLKKGGCLIYSTCSILPEENEKIVEEFIAHHSDFVPVHPPEIIHTSMIDDRGYFRAYPHRHSTDGFFGAVLAKKSDAKGK
jgi:16S rRNA (cytosine967-C5)-methyltransferase